VSVLPSIDLRQAAPLEFFSQAQGAHELPYADQQQFGDKKDSRAPDLPRIVMNRDFQNVISRIMRPDNKLGREERHVFDIGRYLLSDAAPDQSETCIHIPIGDIEE
jgi:hypothetical protein